MGIPTTRRRPELLPHGRANADDADDTLSKRFGAPRSMRASGSVCATGLRVRFRATIRSAPVCAGRTAGRGGRGGRRSEGRSAWRDGFSSPASSTRPTPSATFRRISSHSKRGIAIEEKRSPATSAGPGSRWRRSSMPPSTTAGASRIRLRRAPRRAVKSAHHFRAAFAPIARRVVVVDDGSGLTSRNYRTLPYRNVRRPVFPLD